MQVVSLALPYFGSRIMAKKNKRLILGIIGVILGFPVWFPFLLVAVAMAVIALSICGPFMLIEYAITGKVK